jgi:hypothetical protein
MIITLAGRCCLLAVLAGDATRLSRKLTFSGFGPSMIGGITGPSREFAVAITL